MFAAAVAVDGPVFVAERSMSKTVRLAMAALFSPFGSVDAADTVAVFENVVPEGVPAGICPVSVKVAVAPAAKLAAVHVIVPPEPAAGNAHVIVGPPVC